MRGQDFHRHDAVQTRIPGAIHFPHATRPQRRLNLIRPESGSRA
jgi:hypothetical protein